MNVDEIRAVLLEMRGYNYDSADTVYGWADRIEAALTDADGACWQPIETAPRNGQPVLGETDGSVPFVMKWDGYGHWRTDPSGYYVYPTHWALLPPARRDPERSDYTDPDDE